MKNVKDKSLPQAFYTVFCIFICIASLWITVLALIEKQNDLTELRLAIPSLAKELKNIEEENIALSYEIERFKSPQHLMELARKPEFCHLKAPFLADEVFLPKMPPLPKTDFK